MTPRMGWPPRPGQGGVGAAPPEPPFLGRKGDEADGVIERIGRQDPGRLEDRSRAAGVIVGPGGQGQPRWGRRVIVRTDDVDVVRVGLAPLFGDDVARCIRAGERERLETDIVEAEGRERGEEGLAGGFAVRRRSVARLEILEGLDARRPGWSSKRARRSSRRAGPGLRSGPGQERRRCASGHTEEQNGAGGPCAADRPVRLPERSPPRSKRQPSRAPRPRRGRRRGGRPGRPERRSRRRETRAGPRSDRGP